MESLKSYRLRMQFVRDVKDKIGAAQQGSQDIVQDLDNAGHALHGIVTKKGNYTGSPEAGAPTEQYYLDGTLFSVAAGTCRFISKKPYSGLDGITVLPEDYFPALGTATLVVPGETVNGVSADHYSLAAAALGRELKGMNISQGDVWIAADGYVVKLSGKATGTDQSGGVGTVSASYDVSAINQVPAIKPPADCVAP